MAQCHGQRVDSAPAINNHTVVDALSATFAALSDPTRRAILSTLALRPASIAELTEPFRISQQAVSKHVACLERAQLLQKRRSGRQQVCYLAPAPLQTVAAWVKPYRRHWEEGFNRLERLLKDTEPARKTRRRTR